MGGAPAPPCQAALRRLWLGRICSLWLCCCRGGCCRLSICPGSWQIHPLSCTYSNISISLVCLLLPVCVLQSAPTPTSASFECILRCIAISCASGFDNVNISECVQHCLSCSAVPAVRAVSADICVDRLCVLEQKLCLSQGHCHCSSRD